MRVTKGGMVFTTKAKLTKQQFDILRKENPKGKLVVNEMPGAIAIGELEYLDDADEPIALQHSLFRDSGSHI